MKKILIILIILVLLLVGGAIALIMSPVGDIVVSTVSNNFKENIKPTGEDCGKDLDCIKNIATTCTVGNSQFSDNEIEGLMQIIGSEKRGCKVYFRIDKHAKMPNEIITLGMNTMTCWFDNQEISNLNLDELDVATLDCEGPLYEIIKSIK
jgi:hypothetical protein